MTTFSRKSLIGAFALMATLSAPLAFAQSAASPPQAAPPTEAATQAETGPQAQTATQAATGAQGATAATDAGMAPAKKSWSDVDTDKDGSLSKTEASTVPALAQVFDQADSNADGTLTADEYKAYVAKIPGGATGGNGGK